MSDNINDKDRSNQPTGAQSDAPPIQKLSEDDKSLSIVRRPTLNRKVLRLGAMAVGGVICFAIFVGLVPHKKASEQTAKSKPDFSQEVPQDLDVNPADYSPLQGERPPAADVQPYSPSPRGIASDNSGVPVYQSYPQTPSNARGNAQFPSQTSTQGTDGQGAPGGGQQPGEAQPKSAPWVFPGGGGLNAPSEEERRRLAALTSPFFFPWTAEQAQSGNPQNQGKLAGQQSGQQPGQMTDAQSAALEAAYDTAAAKQNMAKEKQAFIEHQSGDYGAYLDNHYITPIDAKHLLQAGTYMPITMVTGINSDLPGTIIAQVTENVFDSLTGENILIPRGSRLLGTYDNSIAFGQDRVLVAWERLIRTDGVSISLRGMKGADLQGKSGLHDQVDYHVAQILAVVGASTAFNIGTNAAIAALSTNQFLSSLAQAMTAQGSTSSNTTAAANQVAIDYANRIIDQQPTIVIREGTQAYCVIDKDMILPAFVDQDGGYMAGN
jgi:type IV secretion system protein VirB10